MINITVYYVIDTLEVSGETDYYSDHCCVLYGQ